MTNTVLFQRLEAAFIFAGSVYFYYYFGFSFLWFAVLLFTMDVFMAGYLIDKRIGAFVYNLGHSLFVPATLFVCGALFSSMAAIALGLIWAAHIGMDRTLGYGLKKESGFKHTHLGQIGKE